jgi:hypothetical protein
MNTCVTYSKLKIYYIISVGEKKNHKIEIQSCTELIYGRGINFYYYVNH